MTDPRAEAVTTHIQRSLVVLERAANDQDFLLTIIAIAEAIADAVRGGGKLLIAGNGGSAADAQHMAGEFLSRLKLERSPLPALALTTDTSVLTAIGNDFGFERIFERQVRGLGRKGDVLLAISTSGRSPNILEALGAAREIGMTTIGFTGTADTAIRALCDLTLTAPADETPLIQQLHITAAHAVCELVEQELFAPGRSASGSDDEES